MYKCQYCDKIYQGKNNFSSHFWRCHKIKYKEYFDTFIEPWFHKCPYCEKERGFHKGKYFTTCCSTLCKRKADVDTKLKKYGDEKYCNKELISLKYKSLTDEELNRRKNKLSKSLKNRSDEDKAKTLNKRRLFYQSHYGVDCFAQTHEGHVKSKKKYIHNGIKFDSKLEIAIYDYCIENGIEVIYQPKSLEYYVNGKLHIYHPDFLINGKLYEAKGAHLLKDGHLFFPFRSKLSEAELKRIDTVYEAKENCMRENNVTIITNDDIDNLKNIFIL